MEKSTSTSTTSGPAQEWYIKVGTCKDCKWWGRDEYHYCENPNIGVKGKFNNDCAWSEDPFCSIQTGPDFGCIHHEPKEKQNANKN